MQDPNRIGFDRRVRFGSSDESAHWPSPPTDGDIGDFLFAETLADRALNRRPVGHPDRSELFDQDVAIWTTVDVEWHVLPHPRFSATVSRFPVYVNPVKRACLRCDQQRPAIRRPLHHAHLTVHSDFLD
jgi:hypothetical protein